MKPRWTPTTASGALRLASSGQRSLGTAAVTSAPVPPSATITRPSPSRSSALLTPLTLARWAWAERPELVDPRLHDAHVRFRNLVPRVWKIAERLRDDHAGLVREAG